MRLKTLTLIVAAGSALAAPLAASAQNYHDDQQGRGAYGYGDNRGDDQSDRYDRQNSYRSSGDYYQRRRSSSGVYPQFRGIEQHIRAEIYSSVRDDMIARDDAQNLLAQLQSIQNNELREFRVHGRNLPYDDQRRIQQQLSELDQLVDQTRQEQ